MTKANAKPGAVSAPESVDVPLSPEAQTGPFFRRVDWAAFWTVFAVTLAAYAYTMAPTVTLEDSGELAVGSAYMGVPHPPGYPIWTLATWFFQWIFKFQTMHGHPNPAWGVAFCSVFFGALACGTLGMLISRSGADLLRSIRRFDEVLGPSTESLFCWAGGVSGGLLLAFSPVLWSQAVIVEVYAMNGFFQMILMLLLYRWMCRPKENGTLYAVTFLFGLGLTNHQTLMFLGLALAVGVMLRAPALFRDFLLVGGALLALLIANVACGKVPGLANYCWLAGPDSAAFWVYTILAVAIPIAGAWILPNGKTVCWSFLAVELGAAFYLFMPVSSEQNPGINWGYPRTWEGFLHAISRGQYERINPANIFTGTFIDQVFSYLSTLRGQFTLPLLLAGFLPLCVWKVRLGRVQLRAFHLALLFTLGAVVMVFLEHIVDIPGQPDPAFIHIGYKVMTFGIMLLAAVGVAWLLMDAVGVLIRLGRSESILSAIIAIVLLAGLALGVGFIYFQLFKALFGADIPGLMRLVLLVGMAVPPATIVALFLLRKEPFAFDFEFGPAAQRWLLTTVIGFVSVTFIFIAVLNPQLDVQTMFIGRVEFVQTHSLFALWLGYGVLFALAMIETLAGGRKFFRWPTAIFALTLPLVLIWKNGYDKEFIRIFGGSEQNGHEFGWQFGNWELRGVNGIKEDLQFDKQFEQEWAAFPNKAYPPEMSSNAIFFGGTDPGRFVPTYMIYAAKVRPDVYLITQNALADNTYLNVMRDLYGDTIWIPSIQDSNLAFQQYVSDVRGGRINPGAEVDMKDGRISVQGVAGVMHINGILARMIFEANKDKHEFYVEESYVIPWMYDFMEPCGLILKLNGQPTPLTDAMVKNDRDFWDWYAKRLLGDTKFLRDVVARKTFSKLRSAIAGLYAARGRFPDAEYAFQQSIDLYPLSPEANFRLADIFVAEGKYDQSRKLIEEFLRGDPKNDKVREFIKHVDDVEKVTRRRQELEQMAASGRLDLTAAMELVDLCRKTQQWPRFEAMVRGLLTQPQPLPPPAYLQLGQMCGEVGRLDLLDQILVKYISVQPADTRIRVELAAVRVAAQNLEGTLAAVREAVEKGGETARNLFRGDQRFDPIRGRPEFQQLVPAAAPAPFQIPGKLQDMFR